MDKADSLSRGGHGHAYDVVPANSAADALDILLQRAFGTRTTDGLGSSVLGSIAR